MFYVDVDTQYDFCDPKGALAVKGAQDILPNIRSLLAHAQGSLIVGSVDTHDFSAWEFAENGGPFPPHCVKGTPGWLKMPGTLPSRAVFVPNVDVTPMLPDGFGALYFEKEVYSLFANPAAESTLKRLTKNEPAVVFGVATDYCVLAAALGLRERGYTVYVVEDAVAGVAEKSTAEAWQKMRAAGCLVCRTEDVLTGRLQAA